jgi:hypothetical protein
MKRVTLLFILVTLLLSGVVFAWEGQGTRLDRSSLPEGWTLALDFLASPNELQMFSNHLGVNVILLRNYVLNTSTGNIQINFVVTETEAEAQGLYELFLGFHLPEHVGLHGRRVMEIVTEHQELVDLASASLRFGPEAVDTPDLIALRKYLSSWSWPAKDLGTITTQLRSELARYRVFLVGESHGMVFNQELESVLLEFFVRDGGVRNLLLELSPSIVGFLREYVETGDENLLYRAFSTIKGTYFWTKENYAHWKKVHQLWSALPQGEKIKLIGLDVEHQPLLALQYLQHLLDKVGSSELSATKLGVISEILQGKRSISQSEVDDFLAELLGELHTELVKSELGELAEEFELVLSSLRAGLQLQTIQDSTLWNDYRDQAMYQNFLKQISLDGDEKYFGQWGLNHVYQSRQDGVEWLASSITKTQGFEDSVFSMVLVYQDSHYRKNYSYEVLPFDNYLTGTNALGEIAQGEPLLVKLDGANSPFTQDLLWKIRGVEPSEGTTTDYYQYLLFVPGAEASTPLAL